MHLQNCSKSRCPFYNTPVSKDSQVPKRPTFQAGPKPQNHKFPNSKVHWLPNSNGAKMPTFTISIVVIYDVNALRFCQLTIGLAITPWPGAAQAQVARSCRHLRWFGPPCGSRPRHYLWWSAHICFFTFSFLALLRCKWINEWIH